MITLIAGGAFLAVLLVLLTVMLVERHRRNKKITEVVAFKPVDIEAYKRGKAERAAKVQTELAVSPKLSP